MLYAGTNFLRYGSFTMRLHRFSSNVYLHVNVPLVSTRKPFRRIETPTMKMHTWSIQESAKQTKMAKSLNYHKKRRSPKHLNDQIDPITTQTLMKTPWPNPFDLFNKQTYHKFPQASDTALLGPV